MKKRAMKTLKLISWLLCIPVGVLIAYQSDSIILRIALSVISYIQGGCVVLSMRELNK